MCKKADYVLKAEYVFKKKGCNVFKFKRVCSREEI